MATVTKQFNFGTFAGGLDAQGWVFNAGGGTGLTSGIVSLSGGGGGDSPNDPETGEFAFQVQRSGKSLTNGTPYIEWSGTYEDLGVPAGATVTAIDLDYDWRCSQYTTGASSTTGPAELRDSAATLRGTFSTSLAFTATTSWATRGGTNLTGLTDASATSIKLRIGTKPNTGSSTSAAVLLYTDWVVVTVTYTPVGGSTPIVPRPTIVQQAVQRAAVR